MSYQVLARKWRPKSFSETAGQEHVLQALINALDHDRLHHRLCAVGQVLQHVYRGRLISLPCATGATGRARDLSRSACIPRRPAPGSSDGVPVPLCRDGCGGLPGAPARDERDVAGVADGGHRLCGPAGAGPALCGEAGSGDRPVDSLAHSRRGPGRARAVTGRAKPPLADGTDVAAPATPISGWRFRTRR